MRAFLDSLYRLSGALAAVGMVATLVLVATGIVTRPLGIYLPGTEVTIQFTESDDITKQFKQWKSTDTEPEAPDGGWTA